MFSISFSIDRNLVAELDVEQSLIGILSESDFLFPRFATITIAGKQYHVN